ncbi:MULTISPECIES: TonB-dependent siderophore receptor [unclassified Pseudoalteromonas]|uniref:TonB-dependent siderophore receptor n=1 Tax=unclassified Pseudoalteromonas TaxID=194690 RepID=UPI0023599A4C|nr:MULTISPECIES: TonB-dependent siderophore receptor [unclassified Pseudoalteromonas]MDC9565521.1 TonB-dependent siderophore receptor [Pseudoalteromonas sp. GAB2316C]MDC9569852.1 TonB-dependent siderophore receptor [Pseudoalteromonas sp. GABNB9D]MDC9573963.1 TonB-dependent siderophore receptor [Pseudoalteromonas sp. GABNS16A]MDC9578369.1 TonB-dependent siderophore receptor [Pseudoalteromonas sp. GABNS16E]MDC9586013.1 TonB-dependent siderophore receptor [Pseudoalteromonas sp. GABNS16C]
MKTNTTGLKLTYLSACLVSLFSSHALAAEQNQQTHSANTNIERLAVVATRQAYQGNFNQLETPQSELKIDLEALENAGAVSLDQALDLSASVARQNNFGGLWNSFSLRGFVGDENLPSNYLVNGFNAGRGFGGSRDLSGIESVEVLKGPRAALFGRGEPGGTVNLVTKRPTFDTQGEIKLSIASFDTYRADVDYTTALNDDVAIRLVGFYEDAESFRDTIETTKHGFSPSIVWNINDSSQLVYELEYSDQEVPFDRGVLAIDGELGLIPQSRFLGEPGDGPIEADVLGHQLEYIHDFDDNWSILFGANYRDTSMEGFATETGFGGVFNGEVNRFRRYRDFDAQYHVLRAELSGSLELGGFEHRLIMGVDADKFENDQFILRVRGEQYINVFNPVYGAYELPTPTSNTDRVEIQESLGGFIQDQISVTDNLDIRIGARFDDYEQRLNNRLAGTNTKQMQSRVSPQFGVVYEASDYVSVYAAYGENFRPLSGTDTNGDGFEPNQSTSAELGVKFTLNDGALFGTVAVFKVDQDNMLVVDDPTAFTYAAIGEAQSKGIEIDLTGELSDSLEIWASYAYVDAQIENSFFDANFGYTVEAGESLLNVPEHQLSLQLVKSGELYGNAIKFGGGLLFVDEHNGYFGTDFKLPSYTTARVFVNYDVTDAIGVTAEVNNLFDETYYTNSFADAWVQPGTPRNVKFSASYKF